MPTRTARAFTLIELMVVVAILGIMAAVVVPQFAGATQDAKAGNIQSQISEIQHQLELAQAHATDGLYPDLVTDQFVSFIGQGYIRTLPRNPFNGLPTVANAAAGADPATGEMAGVAGFGWAYHRPTGSFTACYWDEANGVIDINNP